MGAGCPWGSRVSCAGRERGKGSARAPLEASGEVCSGRSSRCAAPRPLREARSPPGAAAGGSGCRTCPVPLQAARGRSQQGSLFSLLTSFHLPLGCSWLGPAGSSSPAPLKATTAPGGGKTSPKGAAGPVKGHGGCLPAGVLLPVPSGADKLRGPAITRQWDELGSERTEGAAPDVSLQK